MSGIGPQLLQRQHFNVHGILPPLVFADVVALERCLLLDHSKFECLIALPVASAKSS
jgi:hypothetical protein